MADIREMVAGMTTAEQQVACLVLDQVSRPLTVREIEGALHGRGVSRTQRKIIAKALEPLHILALVGPEHG